MEKQIKPFEQVLVRDNKKNPWKCDIFSHYIQNDTFPHVCIGNAYVYCIPYNEETAHLVGTCNPYKEPEPKEWEIRSNNGTYIDKFTSSELKHFIEKAVIDNKDITNFTVTRVF